MRAFACLLFLLCLSSVAAADARTVRVALARGPALRADGVALASRAPGDAPAQPLGPAFVFEAVGPFVSDGEGLWPSVFVEDAGGVGPVVGGVPALGRVEIVALDSGLLAVDHVPLETYVASVVGAEMPAGWPVGALEAQAVAARTYVLSKMRDVAPGAPFDVEATVLHQAYRGGASLDPRTRQAAERTQGLVLMRGEALADAFFFSACVGTTESAQAAFGTGDPRLVPVSCAGGEASPLARWTKRLPVARANQKLFEAGVLGDELVRMEVAARTATGRAKTVRLVTRRSERTLPAADLRRVLGYQLLPSLDVRVSVSRGELVFEGRGSGHGVGLCQWCARGRAAGGESPAAILEHFYPGTELRRLP